MGPARALARATHNVRRHGLRALLLAGGVALGTGLLVFLLAFVSGTRRALLDRVVSSLPITHLTVVPRAFSLSVLRFESPFSSLDQGAVVRIASIEGVERVMPMAGLGLPAQLRARFFGQGFVTDTGVFGIEPALVADQLPPEAGFASGVAAQGATGAAADEPIPAVISADLIDMYNTGFAKANDLPQLTPEILRGQDAVLILGSSSFNPRPGEATRAVPIRLVGVSDRVPLVGVSLPLPVVVGWNRDLAGEGSPQYVQLVVVAERAEEVDQVAGQIESMGYTVTTGREIAERVRTLTRVLEAAFATIGLVVLAVAGVGIANALLLSVMERRHEIGIFRSVGASRSDIRLLFLCEAALIGALGAVAGAGLAILASYGADRALDLALPDLPLLPESFFHLSWPILAVGLMLGLFVSVLAAVSPAHRAARLDPARILKAG
ncbi:MAG TPA: ABC transporter permease [Gemmatimonadota bacterium]|nr:ABC transporter permease [Gemmatimonadota bacterium]